MKKHFLMAAVAASLMLAGCGSGADDDEAVTVTVTGSANVRDAATAEGSSVLETLAAGTELTGQWVESDANPSEQWFEYERDGEKAYVWGRNLRAQKRGGDSLAASSQNSQIDAEADRSEEEELRRLNDFSNHLDMEKLIRIRDKPFEKMAALTVDCTDALTFMVGLPDGSLAPNKISKMKMALDFWQEKHDELLRKSAYNADGASSMDLWNRMSDAADERLKNHMDAQSYCHSDRVEWRQERECAFMVWAPLKSRVCVEVFNQY